MDAHFQYCANYLRQHDYGRYLASLYLKEEVRQAAFAIYSFNCEIRQIPTLVSDPVPGEMRIQWWRETIIGNDSRSGNPVARALQETIIKHGLPTEVLERLLSARIFDLYNDPMTDRIAFETYLGETNSNLFHLLTMVASKSGVVSTGRIDGKCGDACGHAGIFTGTVELLKRLAFHEYRQQCYFPDELSRHQRLVESSGADQSKKVGRDWLMDIADYALGHQAAANRAICKLPDQVQKLFYGNACTKLELNHIVKQGIDMAIPYRELSRLRINWCLWKAVRTGRL